MKKSLLAKNLKLLRSINHLNQDALARACGVTRNRIASYETQNVEPKLELLSRISSTFQVSLDDLITTEITRENYPELQEAYLRRVSGEEGPIPPHEEKFIIEPKVIDDFIQKNVQIGKMVEGIKAYHSITGLNDIDLENQQLMDVLEHLLAVNKSLLIELNKISKAQM
jgi:transcriptional regulator with XRE-family HTH domain